MRARELQRAEENRQRIAQLKVERGCADCGYNKNPVALEFDHKPGFTKVNTVASLCHASWAAIEAEIAKCDVVCCNCHAIRSAARKWHKKPRPMVE